MTSKLTEEQRALVEENINLVHYAIRRKFPDFTLNRNEYDELVSVGMIGLMNAAMAYKGGNGDRFSTYGVNGVVYEILKYLRLRRNKWGHVLLMDDIAARAGIEGDGDTQTDYVALMNKLPMDEMGYYHVENRMMLDYLKSRCSFTQRQNEMYAELLNERSVKEAGTDMGITVTAVRKLQSSIYRKICFAGEQMVKEYYL